MADEGGNSDVFVYMGGDQEVPRNVRYVRVHKSVNIITLMAFLNCERLVSIEMHDGVEIIEELAFFGCRSLREIKLSGVRVIEKMAFFHCIALTNVEFGDKVETIGRSAFATCPRLRRITLPSQDNLIKTVSSLLLESWRNEMNDEIDRINRDLPNTPRLEKTTSIRQWIERVLERIEHYKSEHYILLKDAMSLLELALWKANLDDNNVGDVAAAREGVRVTRGQRKKARKDRCITSGASVVIKNVLPFLKLE